MTFDRLTIHFKIWIWKGDILVNPGTEDLKSSKISTSSLPATKLWTGWINHSSFYTVEKCKGKFCEAVFLDKIFLFPKCSLNMQQVDCHTHWWWLVVDSNLLLNIFQHAVFITDVCVFTFLWEDNFIIWVHEGLTDKKTHHKGKPQQKCWYLLSHTQIITIFCQNRIKPQNNT